MWDCVISRIGLVGARSLDDEDLAEPGIGRVTDSDNCRSAATGVGGGLALQEWRRHRPVGLRRTEAAAQEVNVGELASEDVGRNPSALPQLPTPVSTTMLDQAERVRPKPRASSAPGTPRFSANYNSQRATNALTQRHVRGFGVVGGDAQGSEASLSNCARKTGPALPCGGSPVSGVDRPSAREIRIWRCARARPAPASISIRAMASPARICCSRRPA